jgi:hypothetical protein
MVRIRPRRRARAPHRIGRALFAGLASVIGVERQTLTGSLERPQQHGLLQVSSRMIELVESTARTPSGRRRLPPAAHVLEPT